MEEVTTSYCDKDKNQIRAFAFFVAGLFAQLVIPGSVYAECTIGVSNGYVTWDGRPIMCKVRDTAGARQQLVYVSGTPYNYIGVRSEGGSVYMGLNEAGVASGNSLVSTTGEPSSNSYVQRYILENYDSLDQIRNYIQSEVDAGTCNASGCFPFIDANENAIMFEINRSNWFLEYDSMDSDRQGQGLLGFVVRANEFHGQTDGTDDTSITGGRYESGTYNISGLVNLDQLGIDTIIQGSDDPNNFEFARYGPGREFATISRNSTRSVMIVHGVGPDEDPNLATMWVILGQSNFGIAVPTWVSVSNIPQSLASGDMYDRVKSLSDTGDEATTQASTFPVEGHMFDVVIDTLLPHWRANGVPSNDANRVEQQMAEDAYSLLYCLDNTQSDNRAPKITFKALPNGLTIDFELIVEDLDGTIDNIEWNFGDNQTSTQASPSHTYVEAGTYLVSCTVTDDDGVSITDWRYYVVPVNCDLAGDDGMVNLRDFAEFAANWYKADCGEPDWCQGTDFDRSTFVDVVDLLIFANHWLDGTDV